MADNKIITDTTIYGNKISEIINTSIDTDPNNDIKNDKITVIKREDIGDAQKNNKECVEQINASSTITIEQAKSAALASHQNNLIVRDTENGSTSYEAYDGKCEDKDIKIGSVVVLNGITYQYNGENFQQMIDYDNKTLTTVEAIERTNIKTGEKYTYVENTTKDINFIFATDGGAMNDLYTIDTYRKIVTPEHEHAFWTYTFGIDKLALYHTTTYNISCFISDEINIGNITDKTNLAIEVSEYEPNNTSIEYYLIDGNKTIPMYPRSGKTTTDGVGYVKDELIFKDIPRRFIPTTNSSDSIKKNCIIHNTVTFDTVDFNNSSDIYTVSYYTTPTVYHPQNQNVRIKIILRKYQDEIASPYVKYVNLIKIGGSALWKDI